MKTYKVIGEKLVKSVDGKEETFLGTVEVTSAKGRKSTWDPGSQITDMQVTEEQAKQLIEAGQIEILEAPEPKPEV